MKISLIIPTRNRAATLQFSLTNLAKLQQENQFEVIVVDNNSSDETRKVAKQFSFVQYVFEQNTAFTRARNTGAKNAKGDILVFIDDDAILHPRSMNQIIKLFKQRSNCAMIAGRVEPGYAKKPPQWVLDCQARFNGLSIFTPENISFLTHSSQVVPAAVGPFMAVRADVYHSVGGFPPDTVGVETDDSSISFRKLYIGPGDYGLCYLVRRAGWQIYYDKNISCTHLIAPSRYTTSFWRSRLIGEGQEEAIIQRQLYHFSKILLSIYRAITILLYVHAQKQQGQSSSKSLTMLQELNLHHLRGYLEMSWILDRYPKLGSYLWKLGVSGIDNAKYHQVVSDLPSEYIAINNPALFYDDAPKHTLDTYLTKFEILDHHIYGSSSEFVKLFFKLPFFPYLLKKLATYRELCMLK